jgi:hypothetical protein
LGGPALAPLAEHGIEDWLVGELDRESAAHLWSARFAATESCAVTDVAHDPSGALVVVGVFRGELDLGTGTLRSQARDPGRDIFVAKLPRASD